MLYKIEIILPKAYCIPQKIPEFHLISCCGKVQFPHSFGRIARNYEETVPFPQNFHIRKLSEIPVFYAVTDTRLKINTFSSLIFILVHRKHFYFIRSRTTTCNQSKTDWHFYYTFINNSCHGQLLHCEISMNINWEVKNQRKSADGDSF